MVHGYTVIYAQAEEGKKNWGAYVPDLPCCVVTGATIDECRERMTFSLHLHLQAMREDGDPIPEPTTVAEVLAA